MPAKNAKPCMAPAAPVFAADAASTDTVQTSSFPAYGSDFRAVVSNAIWLERLRLALSSKRGARLGGLFRACKNGMKPGKLEPWRNRPSKKYRKRRNKRYPRMVPRMVSYAPKTQKALNNQGFEYGGSVVRLSNIPQRPHTSMEPPILRASTSYHVHQRLAPSTQIRL